MPLDLTPYRPPYYELGTQGQGKTALIYTNVTEQTTTGTTPLPTITYTLPPNTMTTNGDILILEASGNSDGAGPHHFTLEIDTGVHTLDWTGLGNTWSLRAVIQRKNTVTASISYYLIPSGQVPQQLAQYYGSLDYTTTMLIRLILTADTGLLTQYLSYISKQLN